MARDTLIGQELHGTYKIERLIGKGGMGSVYEASHLRVYRKFAIKVLNCTVVGDEKLMARFKREAMLGSRLGHDHIVPVLDFDYTDKGNPYLVMELQQGKSLGEVMKEEGTLPLVRACSVVQQVCRALSAAHAEGVVHRDLKPDNIFLCPRQGGGEHVVVMDFGVSKVLDSESILTEQSTVLGTPWYMSPEQAAGKSAEVDHRSDIFSLGVVFYQMLAGERPFEGDTIPKVLYQVVTRAQTPLSEVRPDLPEGVTALVGRTLEKKREERCPSAAELVSDLSAAMGDRWTEVLVAELGSGAVEDLPAPTRSRVKRARPDDQLQDTVAFMPSGPAGVDPARADTEMSRVPSAEEAPTLLATLYVEATARGESLVAEIYLDGARLERTPSEIADLPPGRYTLRLVCEGYQDKERTVVLHAGCREEVKVTLLPM